MTVAASIPAGRFGRTIEVEGTQGEEKTQRQHPGAVEVEMTGQPDEHGGTSGEDDARAERRDPIV
jgi:hypothetical protein